MLQIQSYSCRGQDHLEHNEDALLIADLGGDLRLLAIMDGCSSGEDSHFAATLMGKILKKVAKELAFKSFVERSILSPENSMDLILKGLFEGMKRAKAELMLEIQEMLATAVLLVLDLEKQAAHLQVIGDGWLAVDDRIYDFDQGNKPDYLAYHLKEGYEKWRENLGAGKTFIGFSQLVLASDGVHNFRQTVPGTFESMEPEQLAGRFLELSKEHPQAIRQCLKTIKEVHGCQPCDDFTMIWVH